MKSSFSKYSWLPFAMGAVALSIVAVVVFVGGQLFLLANENTRLRSDQPSVVNTTDINWRGGTYTRTDGVVRVVVAVDTGMFGSRIQSCINKILVHVNSEPAGYLDPEPPTIVRHTGWDEAIYPQPAATMTLNLKRGEKYVVTVSADHWFKEQQTDGSVGQGIAESTVVIRPESDTSLNFSLRMPWQFVDDEKILAICQK